MILIRPPYIEEGDSSEEDKATFARLWATIGRSGLKRGLLLQDVITNPEQHGIKNVVRQELLKIVSNTLNKAGYIGKPEDFRLQNKLFSLLQKQEQEGGMF